MYLFLTEDLNFRIYSPHQFKPMYVKNTTYILNKHPVQYSWLILHYGGGEEGVEGGGGCM